MRKQNNVQTLKTVSADTKKSLALPIEITNLEDLRKLVEAGPDHTPRDIFVFLIVNKGICTQARLMEMFGLPDNELKSVFYEYGKGERDYQASDSARWILTREYDLKDDGEIDRLHFTPGQKKLRSLLLKCINISRFEIFMDDLEEEYGIDILYDYYEDVVDDNTITEEELLDALRTYQAEHQA